jgi:hypothetical protein
MNSQQQVILEHFNNLSCIFICKFIIDHRCRKGINAYFIYFYAFITMQQTRIVVMALGTLLRILI